MAKCNQRTTISQTSQQFGKVAVSTYNIVLKNPAGDQTIYHLNTQEMAELELALADFRKANKGE